MIITKVILTDYGVYGGRNEFDLTPVQDRPIILFGGTNGAGKTTLFEAIPLCLYGISAADRRITRAAYNKFLAKKVHRYQKSAIMADSASIVVQFKFYHNSKETEYRVERSWQATGGHIIDEQLNVKKRTSPRASFKDLDTMEASHWQSFVSDIIPKGILRLFFFDGERVVEIAKEGAEDVTIRDAFKSLLGIEIVEQLHTDLQVNLTRNLMGDDKSLQDEITKCEVEREETTHSIERLRERLCQRQAEMDLLSAEIESAESSISKIGGTFASDRDTARTRLGEARAKHEVARRQITEMCSDALYTALIPRQIDLLLKQMDRDAAIFQNKAAANTLDGKIKELSTILCADAGLDDNQKRAVQLSITKFARDEMYKATVEKPVFGLSESQATSIRDAIHRADTV
ncbi:MAG: DNA sulfur modification protein DndD, partial [Candidatus Dadabacteria bacterium]|nr:DNA sulfur modification protein DndD [Candidatus Dadabacteria bacterium]